jgi:hypothetical protein
MSDETDAWIYYGWIAFVSMLAAWLAFGSDLFGHAGLIWMTCLLLAMLRVWRGKWRQ